MLWRLTLSLLLLASFCSALDNGLALTPPMGWLSWARFFCEIDCEHHPLGCINEDLYMAQADRLVSDGYREAGYNLVNIDDCWPAMQRDAQNRLVPDPIRFSHGIQFLSDYMHKRGLKLGIYEDYGTTTCGGYPGSINYLEIDAKTFASWEVDMLKLDGCNADVKGMDQGYPAMEHFLNTSGRAIIYSCSWPDYQRDSGMKPNYTLIGQHCNLWRNYDDIMPNWNSIQSIINYYDLHQDELVPYSGPGKWNDPDMIVVGNPGITVDQAEAQMAIWSIYAAPLLMSNDLRFITDAQKAILLNRKVIAIDQDPLGIMGRLVANTTNVGGYVRPVTPVKGKSHSYAVAFLNRHLTQQAKITSVLSDLGLTNPTGYSVENLYTNEALGTFLPTSNFTFLINPTGVVMLKATVLASSDQPAKPYKFDVADRIF